MSALASIKGVRAIMQRHNLYTRKGLGQNFLIDQNILTKIADSVQITGAQYIIEIGPGLGALSSELAARSLGLLAIDIDPRLEAVLAETLAAFDNVKILFQDILKTDIELSFMTALQLKEIVPYKVCANIPYNITTPIIFKLLESCPHMQSATLMMQKEVANRIMATPGGKEYGRLTIATAYHARVEHILNVSRNCFYPSPEVDSVVLRFTPHQEGTLTSEEEQVFKQLLNSCFQQRRKTILNTCSKFFRVDKTFMAEKLRTLGLEPNLRPENLALPDYITLVKEISHFSL